MYFMKEVLFLLFMVSVKLCCAQETSRKIIYSKNGDREIYYVLASNNKLRHGSYEKKVGQARLEGHYTNGKKDGIWTEYSKKNRLKSVGRYVNDEPVGLWKFYDWSGELEQEYDFGTGELVSDVLLPDLKERPFKIIKGADTLYSVLERPPVYIGGKTNMQSDMMRNYRMPLVLLAKLSGSVRVGFTIDSTGRPADYRVIQGMGFGCDEEALKMVKQMPGKWVPAIFHGAPVKVEHLVVVFFKGNY
jgi:TonB family protein